MEPTGHWACLSAGRKGSPAAGRTTARSKVSVARAFMATAQAIDVDRRSTGVASWPLLLGRCFLAVASCPKRDATPWGINSAGPGRVESELAHEGMGAGRQKPYNCKVERLGRIQSMPALDRKSTRLNSSHLGTSYAVFRLKQKIEAK